MIYEPSKILVVRDHFCSGDCNLKQEELKCELCGKTFEKLKFYLRHYKMKHKALPPGFEGSEIFKCDNDGCDFFSKTKSGLEGHKKRVHLMEECHFGTQEKAEKLYHCER